MALFLYINTTNIILWITLSKQSDFTDPYSKIYWDCGSKGIEEFLDAHAEPCKSNHICNLLRLREVQVIPPGDISQGSEDEEEDQLASDEESESEADGK